MAPALQAQWGYNIHHLLDTTSYHLGGSGLADCSLTQDKNGNRKAVLERCEAAESLAVIYIAQTMSQFRHAFDVSIPVV